jgi:hypothetical protein
MALIPDFPGSQSGHTSIQDTSLVVHSCPDFNITGMGDNAQWEKTLWVNMQKLDQGGEAYKSRFKILYSVKGIYVLFHGEDKKINSYFKKDFDKIFKADVFEVFFHPNPLEPIYFEYEISPLSKELVLFMIKRDQMISGWRPWPYEKETRVKKIVRVLGGEMRPGAAISSWTAELFFPYSLLSPFQNIPPQKGTRWNANFCRLDYDSGNMVKWAWAPVDSSFHELNRYYSLRFE